MTGGLDKGQSYVSAVGSISERSNEASKHFMTGVRAQHDFAENTRDKLDLAPPFLWSTFPAQHKASIVSGKIQATIIGGRSLPLTVLRLNTKDGHHD